MRRLPGKGMAAECSPSALFSILQSPRNVGGGRTVCAVMNVKSEGLTESTSDSTCIGDIGYDIRYSSKDHCSLLFLPLLYNVIHETLVLE